MQAITEIRLRLRANGYHPIPVKGKAPRISGWQGLLDTTPAQIERWEIDYPDHTNTGILTKFTPCLDIDVHDQQTTDFLVEFVRGWIKNRGGVLLRRVGQPPKCAIFFKTNTPFKKIALPLRGPSGTMHKLEFLGDGQQAVVHGIHPDTKRPYEWVDGADLCDVPADQLPRALKG